MALRLNGSTSGYVELDVPAVAGTTALTLPATSGTVATQAYVDTAEADAINTAIAGGGLVHIATESFSAVSSVSINGCFTSAYKDYLIRANFSAASGSPLLSIRMRASGSDESSSDYHRQRYTVSDTSLTGERLSSQTSATLTFARTNIQAFDITITNPQVAKLTNIYTSIVINYSGGDVTLPTVELYGNVLNNTTGYDGFTVFPASSTITGTLRVYGYKD